MKSVSKAIIPAAGYGTRHLPITKALPKELLPILDRPSVDYVVEECVLSGITDICIVLSRGKGAVEDYFDRNPEIEANLARSGKRELLKKVNPYLGKVNITYIRQPEMKGTAYAIGMCREFTGGDAFAVLFPDDVVYNPEDPATAQLIRASVTTGSTIVGVKDLPPEEAVKYGVMVPAESKGRYVRIKGFVEKPDIKTLPSTITSVGRFVLTPDIYYYIGRVKPAANGERYLTDAIDAMAKDMNVYAYTFDGTRYDTGSTEGFLKANLDYALREKELGAKISEFLKTR